MTDTVRTTAALQALLSDGAAAHSTNRQLIRDLLVSLALQRDSVVFANDAPYNAVAGTDATQALSDAAAALSSRGGGELVLGYGVYTISPNTVVSVGGNNYFVGFSLPANVTLRGMGKYATTLKAVAGFAASGKMILINGVNGVRIRDIGFDGNIANQTLVTTVDNGYTAVAVHNNCNSVGFDSVSFTGFTQDAIHFGYPNGTLVEGFHVSHCDFYDWQRGAVVVVGGRNGRIHHNKFANSTRGLGSIAQGSVALWLEPNVGTDPIENITFDHNTLDNINVGGWIFNSHQTDLFSVSYDHNTHYDVDTGLYGQTAYGLRAVENTFHLCGQNATASLNHPIKLDTGCRWATVSGGWFRDCGSEFADIEILSTSRFVKVHSTTHVGSKRGAVYAALSATQYGLPEITDIRVETAGVETPNTYYGIYMKCPVGTPGEDGKITGCTVATSTTTGLAAAYKSENWQAGIFDDNFQTGTGLTVVQVGSFMPGYGSVVWDPPSIAAGSQATTTVTVAGANFTDSSSYDVIPPYTLAGLHVSAYCSSVNTVTILLANNTAGAIDLGSGTWGIKMRKKY